MVERLKSKRKRIMREFMIKELSAVDSPAQKHALAVLMKRADDADEETPLDKNGEYASAPAVVASSLEAMNFDEVLAENQSREAAARIKDCVWSKWSALQRSFDTISQDEEVPPADKPARMKESLAQFLDAVRAESAAIAEEITKCITADPALAELLPDYEKGDDAMTDAEKRQLAELQTTVADLTKRLEAATTKEPAKKAAELQGELEKTQAQIAELTEKLAKADAEKTAAEALAKMSDDEKECAAKMSDEDRKAFMDMTPEERRKKMKKSADDNPVVYKSESTGEEFRKNDDPRLVKLAKQADENEKLAKSEIEKREAAELAKRADEEPYRSFSVEKSAGAKEDVTKVDVLRAISKMEEGPRAVLEKWLGIGAKAVAAAFETIGHKNEVVAKSAADFRKRVIEIAARDKIPEYKAMEKAREEFPEEYKAYSGAGGAN